MENLGFSTKDKKMRLDGKMVGLVRALSGIPSSQPPFLLVDIHIQGSKLAFYEYLVYFSPFYHGKFSKVAICTAFRLPFPSIIYDFGDVSMLNR
jgi:hypothetical protein